MVLGKNGYFGRNLSQRLLEETTHTIIGLSPNVETMALEYERFIKQNLDVFDTVKMYMPVKQADVAHYLIHMMAQKRFDFAEIETRVALSFSEAGQGTSISQLIFLSKSLQRL